MIKVKMLAANPTALTGSIIVALGADIVPSTMIWTKTQVVASREVIRFEGR